MTCRQFADNWIIIRLQIIDSKGKTRMSEQTSKEIRSTVTSEGNMKF